MGGAHRQGELDDVPLGGGRFPAVLDRLDIDVACGLQVIAGEVFDEGLVEFWRHLVVCAAEINDDEKSAGNEGDVGRRLLRRESDEVFPRGVKIPGEEAVLPDDPAGRDGAEGMTAEKPLGMLGEGGDSGERLMRLPVGERRAGEKALLRQSCLLYTSPSPRDTR